MGEFCLIVSSLSLAKEIRCSLTESNPVQSWRSFMLIYLGFFVTTRKAMFCRSCSFSIWTSAALMMHTLPYSKTGMITDLYRCATICGLGFFASEAILLSREGERGRERERGGERECARECERESARERECERESA